MGSNRQVDDNVNWFDGLGVRIEDFGNDKITPKRPKNTIFQISSGKTTENFFLTTKTDSIINLSLLATAMQH